MSEIFSVQLTAVATLALAVLALAAAVLAGLAFWRQSQEVRLLLEQNKRDTDERRSAQAARVFLVASIDKEHLVSPYVRNASDLPIYEVRIRYAQAGGFSEPEDLGMIMPGDTAYDARQLPDDQARRVTLLTFRDTVGINWARLPDGRLWERTALTQTARQELWLAIIATSVVSPDGL